MGAIRLQFETWTRYSVVGDEEQKTVLGVITSSFGTYTRKFETYTTSGLPKVGHFRKLGGNKATIWNFRWDILKLAMNSKK